MTYYRLRCSTCGEQLEPVLATEPGELLQPHEESPRAHSAMAAEGAMGSLLVRRLREFHDRHAGHILEEEKFDG